MQMVAKGTTALRRAGLVIAGSAMAFFLLTRNSAPLSPHAKELPTPTAPSNAVAGTDPNGQDGTQGPGSGGGEFQGAEFQGAGTLGADVRRGPPPNQDLAENDPVPLPHAITESQPLPSLVSTGTSRTVRTHQPPQGHVAAMDRAEGTVRTFRPPPQDTSFVRDAMHALHPLFEECDSLARATESSAEFEGLLVVEFVVDVVDDSDERIVRDVSIREGSDALPPLIRECIVETVYTLALAPSEGRPVRVTYPLHFSHDGTSYQVRGMGPSPNHDDATHTP